MTWVSFSVILSHVVGAYFFCLIFPLLLEHFWTKCSPGKIFLTSGLEYFLQRWSRFRVSVQPVVSTKYCDLLQFLWFCGFWLEQSVRACSCLPNLQALEGFFTLFSLSRGFFNVVSNQFRHLLYGQGQLADDLFQRYRSYLSLFVVSRPDGC